MRSVLTLFAFFVFFASFVFLPSAALGQDLQISGKIVFASDRPGNREIYVTNPDDWTNPTRLTNNPAIDDIPSWSPDGTHIAFTSNRDGNWEIYTINADGTGLTQLTYHSARDFDPAWSPDGSKIAFASNRHGNDELYVMNADGTNQTRLTFNDRVDAWPAWSPDGTKIAIYSARDGNDEIYVMNVDGTNQTRLTTITWAPDYSPSWSPDGTKIVFRSHRDGNSEIYVMDADGSGQTNLTNHSAYDASPDWQPFQRIGSAMVGGTPVSRTMTIENRGGATLTVSNITSSDEQFTISPTSFTVPAGSSQNVTVTFEPSSAGTKYATLTITSNDADALTARLIVNGNDTSPAPSVALSTSSLSFGTVSTGTSAQQSFTVTNVGVGTLSVSGISSSNSMFTVSPTSLSVAAGAVGTVTVSFAPASAGSQTGTLTISHNASGSPSTVSLSGTGVGPAGPDLQISGKIVFASDRPGNREIYVTDPDDWTNPTRLTNNTAVDDNPSWSPDGTRIAFASEQDGNREIYVINVGGTGLTRLTNHLAYDDYPSWSPDGTQIAFFSRRDGNPEIYKMNADGTGLTRLTNNPADDYDPAWSPDGSKIAFQRDLTGGNAGNDIYVMDADGTNQTRLTNVGGVDAGPVWSPDGSKIAIYSARDGNDEIYVMNADGSGQTRLTFISGTPDYSPSWSPDGGKIVFRTHRDSNSEIYVMNADGSDQTRLTVLSTYDASPDWQPFQRIGSAIVGGTPVSRTMTVENKGSGPLIVSDIASSDAQFTINPTNFTVPAGSSENVTVTFNPTSAGTKYTTLTITSNDPQDSTVKLIVNGTDTNRPPDCSQAAPSVASIWPPNHQMVNVNILGVTDPDGDPVTITITRITQDEPLNTVGDGNFEPDGAGIGAFTAQVRAERAGKGNGRVYVISFTASDGKGGTCDGSVKVGVPHDQGKGKVPIDDGQSYNSTAGSRLVAEEFTPETFSLDQSYPNPFNPATTIRYALPEAAEVHLVIYNLLGQKVKTLVHDVQKAGYYRVAWDGKDDVGRPVATGIYVYRLQAGAFVEVKKMVMLK